MTYKLFIDDERFPAGCPGDWVIVRSSIAAQKAVMEFGLPEFISFDHDLGGDDTSRKFVIWLIDWMLDNEITFKNRKFDFYVHSQNPIGAEWINKTMAGMIKNI